jgi:flavodoxin
MLLKKEGLILFGSSTGNSRLVASRLLEMLKFSVDIIDVRVIENTALLLKYDLLILISSTWGDGELQPDMEKFLISCQADLKGKQYAICELGIYSGYDNFGFGAYQIMQHHLKLLGAYELVAPFSMDSLPRKDWNGLILWSNLLNYSMMETY